MLTRRQMLKAGLAGGGYALLGTGYVLLGPGRSRRVFADQLRASPPTTPFLEELPIAPIAQPVARFATRADPANCVNVDGTTAVHVHGPRVVPTNAQFFLIHERPAPHSFHPQLPSTVIWGYNGMAPGPTFLGRSGTPFLVRFVNDLPMNDPVGFGEPITAVHRHGGFQAPEDDGYPLDTFCTGQSRDYFYPQTPAPNVFGLPNPEQNGFLGDKFVFNCKIHLFIRMQRRKYPFRFLNGSNSRSYHLSQRNCGPFDFVIAANEHLFPRPLLIQQSIILGPAERAAVAI